MIIVCSWRVLITTENDFEAYTILLKTVKLVTNDSLIWNMTVSDAFNNFDYIVVSMFIFFVIKFLQL